MSTIQVVTPSRRARRRTQARATTTQVLLSPVAPPAAPVKAQSRPSRRRNRRGQQALSGRNPYLISLLDPEGARGAKVPDTELVPSGTWQWVSEGSFNVAADTNAFIAVNPWAICNSSAPVGTTAATTGRCVVVYSNPTVGFGNVANPLLGIANPAIRGLANRIRPVSACLKTWISASALNTQGTVCSVYVPNESGDNQTWTIGDGLQNFNYLTSQPFSLTRHALNSQCVRWLPSDNSEMEYAPVRDGVAAPATFWGLPNGYIESSNGSIIASGYTGCLSTQNVRYKVCVNYELIPSADTSSLIVTTPSPSQPNWLNQAHEVFTRSMNAVFDSTPSVGPNLLDFGSRVVGYGGALYAERAALRQQRNLLM